MHDLRRQSILLVSDFQNPWTLADSTPSTLVSFALRTLILSKICSYYHPDHLSQVLFQQAMYIKQQDVVRGDRNSESIPASQVTELDWLDELMSPTTSARTG